MHTAFFPLNEDTSPLNEVQWADKLLEVLLQATKRLVAYAQGRPIVIPLSGGWDSRTIALALKKVGYEPLIAFSYGKPKNAEAEVSRDVASQLGIPWLFAEYSLSTWRKRRKVAGSPNICGLDITATLFLIYKTYSQSIF